MNKLRKICFINMFILCFCCACQNNTSADTISTADCYIKDNFITIGTNITKLESNLGSPDEIYSSKSCTGYGEDKSFSYDNIWIYTQPDKSGDDIVSLIELEEGAKLKSGIGVGNSKDEVIEKYGNQFTTIGDCIEYQYENVNLSFTLQNDQVTFIEIYGNK